MAHYKGSDLSQEFKEFFKAERRRIKKVLEARGCTNIEMEMGFNYYSGFFTSASGQVYYFSIDDVRFNNDNRMLYRTAKDYKDYTGGGNCYVDRDKLQEMNIK